MTLRVCIYGLILLGLSCLRPLFADARLDWVKQMAAAGAPFLTLKLVDQNQPGAELDVYAWIRWEQVRYQILSEWRQWDHLLLRVESLPDNIPQQFKDQAVRYQAKAYIELGQTALARKLLRQQLWQVERANSTEYQAWRRLVISSYLQDELTDDARTAMVRFDQDFEDLDDSWLLSRAMVLVQTAHFEQAIQVLAQQKNWQARLITVFAKFRAKKIRPSDLWKQVQERASVAGVAADELAALWVLGVYAAEQMSLADQVFALERYFEQRSGSAPIWTLFQLRPDRLWQAYYDYARFLGNDSALLVGAGSQWLDLAKTFSGTAPMKARAVFALLMRKDSDPDIKSAAARGYLQTFGQLEATEGRLLTQLFHRDAGFADVSQMPEVMRYQLVDVALESADIDLATRLMSGLDAYPEGESRLHWQLRQSRVLILGGHYAEGSQVMRRLLSEYNSPRADDTDRILQVLFDLQTVNHHAEAIEYFNRLRTLAITPQQHREILFWAGDSHKALQQYHQAAALYLQSAMFPGTQAMDPWAQTARYNAAESLQKSGLVGDARRIYQSLLRVTKEPARRALLKNRMQQLWLDQGSR